MGEPTDTPALRVGLLSSWNTRCGIAEYSRNLATALRRRGDVEVSVFGSRNYAERAVRDYEEWATPVFDVQLWHPEDRYSFDIDPILEADLDVLHIQYSNLFYKRPRLIELMRHFEGVLAVTYHDKHVPRLTFPWRMPDLLYAHREDVGIGDRALIPQGIDIRRPVVKTFGLGKSRDDLIAPICERNAWTLKTQFGEQRWMEADELWAWLRDSDAIVLWYDEDKTSGGSAGAPLAIGTRRPVFVNDTEWFSDIPERTATLRKVHTLDELEALLTEQFHDDYGRPRSWDRVAAKLASDYAEAHAVRHGRRAGRRAPLRARVFALMDLKPAIRRRRRLEKSRLGSGSSRGTLPASGRRAPGG